MNASELTNIIAALGSGGIVAALLDYWRNRKKIGAEGRIATRTEASQVGLVSVQELEAKLGYLNRVIAVLEQHNVRLEGDIDQERAMNTTLNNRVRELMHRCDRLEMVVRKLCLENNLDPDKYLD